jgi:hypothetical protein
MAARFNPSGMFLVELVPIAVCHTVDSSVRTDLRADWRTVHVR